MKRTNKINNVTKIKPTGERTCLLIITKFFCVPVFLFIPLLVTTSCVHLNLPSWLTSKDRRPFNLQSINLFSNYASHPESSVFGDGADWILRRERLEAFDKQLRTLKPDVLLLQQSLSRGTSISDSDEMILRAGSLAGFKFDNVVIPATEDVLESHVEYFATAVNFPITIGNSSKETELTQTNRNIRFATEISPGFYTAMHTIVYDDYPVAIFNIDARETKLELSDLFDNLWEFIETQSQTAGICSPHRVVIAGRLPCASDDARFLDFLNKHNLELVQTESCVKHGIHCTTATPENPLYRAYYPDALNIALDVVIVGNTVDYSEAKIVYDQTQIASKYALTKGLESIAASPHYGWSVNLKMLRCRL